MTYLDLPAVDKKKDEIQPQKSPEIEKSQDNTKPIPVGEKSTKIGKVCNGKDCPVINPNDAQNLRALSVENGKNQINKNLINPAEDAEWGLD